MKALSAAMRHLWGLFVDDGRVVISTLGWLALVWLMLTRFALHPRWSALLVFAGVAAILALSATRRTRRGLRRRPIEGPAGPE